MQEPENQQPSSETKASHAEEEKQPIHMHAAERAQHRRQKRERRMIGWILILLLFCTVAFFLLTSLVKHFMPKKGTVTPPASSMVTTQSSVQESHAKEAVSNDSAPSESKVVSDKSEESIAEAGTGIFAGTAQPKANTGDAVQDAKGKGNNHNSAANVYAYNTTDVKEAMYHGKRIFDHRLAFLTFDDGVDSNSTPLLLDTLKELGVPATFFMVGKSFTPNHKALLERTMAEGHALALHSFDHIYEKLYPGRHGNAKEIFGQYKKCMDALHELLGDSVNPKVWRYPGGHMSWKDLDEGDKLLAKEGVQWIDWNCLNGDAEGRKSPTSTKAQVSRIIESWGEYGKPQVITILMHDTGAKTLTRNSVPAIVKALRAEGFSFGVLE